MLELIDLSHFTNFVTLLSSCGLFNTEDSGIIVIGNLIRGAVFAIQIFVPIALIIMGMIDMGKAVMQQKEDDIKKAQQVFVTRLTAAAITFLVITIVKLVVSILAGNGAVNDENNLMECVNFFISGN
jgi:cytochrome c biogenesis factor